MFRNKLLAGDFSTSLEMTNTMKIINDEKNITDFRSFTRFCGM